MLKAERILAKYEWNTIPILQQVACWYWSDLLTEDYQRAWVNDIISVQKNISKTILEHYLKADQHFMGGKASLKCDS